jgi:hypothetical protein
MSQDKTIGITRDCNLDGQQGQEVFYVTMKNVVFWDIKTQFVPHMGHITSPLQSSAG